MTRTISNTARVSAVQISGSFDPRHRRARLLATSILTGGALRSLAAAAGMMTALGVSPAFAQCFSGVAGTLATFNCNATATGMFSIANGTNATATGGFSNAIGTNATATGQSSNAIGTNATATGQSSFANGNFATATGYTSFANGVAATAYGAGANA